MARKERIGTIVSAKAQKTIIVAVQIRYPHPKYGKILVKTKRYMVHDELNIGKCGDLVLVEEIPPKSKQKKWQIKKILKVYQDQKQEI